MACKLYISTCTYDYTFVALASAVGDDDMGSTSTNTWRNVPLLITTVSAVATNCQSGTLLSCGTNDETT